MISTVSLGGERVLICDEHFLDVVGCAAYLRDLIPTVQREVAFIDYFTKRASEVLERKAHEHRDE